MNKEKQFKQAVETLIETSQAEAAPLDVHCIKVKITFGDVEKKVELKMCLLAFCGFHGRLELAKYLIEKGASEFPPLLHYSLYQASSKSTAWESSVKGNLWVEMQFYMFMLVKCSRSDNQKFRLLMTTRSSGIDSGDMEVGSPLLQMMVMHDARRGSSSLSIDTLKFFTEDHPSALTRIITTGDESVHYNTGFTT